MSETRKTVADCEALLYNIGKKGRFRVWKRKTPMPKTGGYFFIEMVYGRPRVQYQYKIGGVSDISPRLPTGKLHEWLRDFNVAGFRNWLKYKMRD